jgi:glucokinase-like ROK family protein
VATETHQNESNIVKFLNKDAVIEFIRRAPEGISRAEIARILDVSRSTISAIVDSLMASGLVLERGAGVSRGGRKPIVLEINAEAGRVVGIDIGATHLVVLLTDLQGHILAEGARPLDITEGPEPCLQQTLAMVENVVTEAQCPWARVLGIGVGVPGPVITAEGMVSAPPIMPGWDRFPIRRRIEERFGKTTSLDNDADLGALGEWTFGAGQGENNLAYIKIGTGIGCGLLLNGQLYRGVLGTAGEIGHFTMSEVGPPCTCGNYGCLEAMAGGRAIAQRAAMAVKAGQRTMLTQLNGNRELTSHDVAVAAEAGDAVSQQLLNEAGRLIGSALASLINLLNPGLVVIGGGVSGAGHWIMDPIHQTINERAMRASRPATRVVPAALGSHSTALGAVSVALTQVFRQYVETHRD